MTRLIILLFLSLFSGFIFLGNKNGRASQAQRGNTGAPGDETQGGQPKTCQACHNQGPIQASVSISVLDSANNAITHYRPGYKYKARVSINASGQDLNGYGFQMIALRNANNTDLDGFSDVNPNNYKIASISGGRTYAEHSNISASNIFDVTWTAPVSGTGSVTFYASGNGVNSNGSTTGDGAGQSSLTLSELSSGTYEQEIFKHAWQVSPNPATDQLLLSGQGLGKGTLRIRVFDSSGRLVAENAQNIQNEDFSLQIYVSDWLPGVYYIQLEQAEKRHSVKVLKL